MVMPYSRRRGLPFTPPVGVRRLPLDLERDGLYPRQPHVVASAIETYQRAMQTQAPPMPHMPQRMLFQQWKTGPNRERRPWPHSVDSWEAMTSSFRSGVPTRVASKLGPFGVREPIHQAVAQRGLNVLPRTPQPAVQPVIARGVRANGPTSRMMGRARPPTSDQLVAVERATRQGNAAARKVAKELAMTSAMATARCAQGRGRR